jgi:TPR repeat protein
MLGLTPFDDDLYYASLVRIGRFGCWRALKGAGERRNEADLHLLARTIPDVPDLAGESRSAGDGTDMPQLKVLFDEKSNDLNEDDRNRLFASYFLLARRMIVRELDFSIGERIGNLGMPYDAPSLRDKEMLFARGLAHERGFGLPFDGAQAAAAYRESGELGCGEALYRLGYLLEMGLASPKGDEDCAALYARAATQGSQLALCALGQRLLFRNLATQDYYESLELFARAREDEWNAPWDYCGLLGDRLPGDSSITDADLVQYFQYDLAPGSSHLNHTFHWIDGGDDLRVRLAKHLHVHGIPQGSAYLSWCHMIGRLLPFDRKLGLEYAKAAAKAGVPEHLHYFAWVLLQRPGNGGARLAITCLERARDGGYESAGRDLDILGENGLLDPDALHASVRNLPPQLQLTLYGFIDTIEAH